MEFSNPKGLFLSKTLLIGLIFFSVNATFSYMFFHINSHKIFVMLIGVTLLFIYSDLIFFKRPAPEATPPNELLKILAIVSAPLLASFPGYLIHKGAFNYNFEYELATGLILILWVVYICKNASKKSDVSVLIACVGLTIIYAGVWAFAEKMGYNPFVDGYHPSKAGEIAGRVKATFGNINYFAGFLNALMPIYFALSLPGVAPATAPSSGIFHSFTRLRFSRSQGFFLAVFFFGAMSLFFTETRAAIAGSLVGLSFAAAALGGMALSKKSLKKIALVLLGAMILSVFFIVFLWTTNQDLILDSRFGALLKIEAWYPRLLPWKTAWESIHASPIFGYGPGSSYNLFFEFLDPFARLYSQEHSYNHAHSEILEYAQEAGIIGLLTNACFWGYIFFQLARIARDPEGGDQRRMAIGIAGGLLAYLIHSSFSVAPRMMVTKLPVYTLFGLTFVLARFHHGEKKEPRFSDTKKRWLVVGVSLFMLAISWTLYLPWALRQKVHTEMLWKTPTHQLVENIEKNVAKNRKNDVYFLERLMIMQLKLGRFTRMKETWGAINELIPHYRDIDYYKAAGILAGSKSYGDWEEAMGVVMEKRRRDKYHPGAMKMLATLSLRLNNKDSFFQEIGDIVIMSLFMSKLISFHDLDRIQIKRKDIYDPILIHDGPDGAVYVQMAEGVLDFLMSAARKTLFNPATDDEKQKFEDFIIANFLSAPYFKPPIRPEYIGEKERLEKIAAQYAQIYASQFSLSDPVVLPGASEYYSRYIWGGGAAQKKDPSVENEIKKRGMEKEMALLKEKTDWELYSKRLDFISLFLRSFYAVAMSGY